MAEVKILITAEDGTKQVFSAVREGAKTAFDSVENSAVASTNKVKSAFDSVKNNWIAITAVVASATGSLMLFKHNVIDAGEELLKMSQQVGISVTNLSGLKTAAELSETNINSVTSGVKFLNKALTGMNEEGTDTSKILTELGITAKDPYEALLQASDAFSKMENGAQKSTLAMQLFGRGGLEMIPMLNAGSDAIKHMQGLGPVITEADAQAMDAFNDNLTLLGKNALKAASSFGNFLIPKLNETLTGISSLNVALASGAIVAVIPMIGKMVIALKAMEIGALSAGLAVKSIGAGIAAGVGYEMGKWLDADIYKRFGIDLSGMNRPTQELTDATEGLAWAQEELAKRQKTVSAGYYENKDAIKAVKDAAEKYADVIKDVNADLLKFAGADFAKNLKDQEKSTDGMMQALQGYLNVTDAVYQKRLNMLFVLGQETDMELQSTAMQKAQAEARLGAWSQYYETLKGLHNSAIEAQKTKTKELLDLETRIKDQRQGYADLTLSLNQKLMTETQKYYSTQEDLEQKFKSALTLTGQAKIDALTQYQTAMAATANAVTQDGQERISIEEAVATALEKTKIAQVEILTAQDALKTAKQAEIDQIGVWKTSLETAMAKASEMMELYKGRITDLGNQIDALQMAKTLTVDTAAAVTQVNSLKVAIDSIPDITYKQVVITSVGGGSSTGSSSGDGYSVSDAAMPWDGPGAAEGTNYVAKTGLVLVHQGEAIIPAKYNNDYSKKMSITLSPTIQIIGADKSGKQLSRELDVELAALVKNARSRLAKALK